MNSTETLVKENSQAVEEKEIHFGLNDLHLSQGKKFLFELLTDGTVDYLEDERTVPLTKSLHI